MPNKIIKDDTVIEDQWLLLPADVTELPSGPVIVPAAYWLANKETLANRKPLGVWINSDESPKLIADSLEQFDIVAVNFPAFTDGRGFSHGRELREQHQYQGEVRAVGHFIRDQLFYLKRCGFNSFALSGANLEAALASFNDFSDVYQASIVQPEPLFNRR